MRLKKGPFFQSDFFSRSRCVSNRDKIEHGQVTFSHVCVEPVLSGLCFDKSGVKFEGKGVLCFLGHIELSEDSGVLRFAREPTEACYGQWVFAEFEETK